MGSSCQLDLDKNACGETFFLGVQTLFSLTQNLRPLIAFCSFQINKIRWQIETGWNGGLLNGL